MHTYRNVYMQKCINVEMCIYQYTEMHKCRNAYIVVYRNACMQKCMYTEMCTYRNAQHWYAEMHKYRNAYMQKRLYSGVQKCMHAEMCACRKTYIQNAYIQKFVHMEMYLDIRVAALLLLITTSFLAQLLVPCLPACIPTLISILQISIMKHCSVYRLPLHSIRCMCCSRVFYDAFIFPFPVAATGPANAELWWHVPATVLVSGEWNHSLHFSSKAASFSPFSLRMAFPVCVNVWNVQTLVQGGGFFTDFCSLVVPQMCLEMEDAASEHCASLCALYVHECFLLSFISL